MFEFKSFKGDNRITFQEGEILYEMVLKRKPINILEIGTYSGYATIFLARALKEINENYIVYSVGNPTDLRPQPDYNLKTNYVSNAYLIKVPNILEKIKEYISEVEMIFIDDCHSETDIIWDSIEKLAKPGTVVIFHDALCKETDEMKVQTVITKIQEQQQVVIIETQDDAGNLNGFAIVEIGEPKEEVVEVAIEEPNSNVGIANGNVPDEKLVITSSSNASSNIIEVNDEKGIEPASEDLKVEIKAAPKDDKPKPKRKRAPRKKKVVEKNTIDQKIEK